MLAIRLQRVGRKKQPLYRMVVSEKTKDTYGDHLEILGQYNPHTKDANLKEDRIKHWISKGAQASESVNNLLINKGVIEGKKQKSVAISKKRAAKKESEKPEVKEESPVEDEKAEEPKGEEATPEAPTEEKKEEPKEESTKETEDKK